MVKIGFVGLGVMGAPMAGHLISAGNEVFVWNRTSSKAEPLREKGATVCATLAEIAIQADILISCVGTSEDVYEVVSQLAESAKPNTLFIDHSTIEPGMVNKIESELREKAMRFVDAPVTGGSMGAVAGTLNIFVGGTQEDAAEAIEVIKPYTKRAERVGPSGSGQLMKLANQIAVGGALAGLCESLGFAAKAGLNLEQAHSMIGGGAGGSWAFQFYGPKILNQDWTLGFSIKNQLKDFRYCEAAAKDLQMTLPFTNKVEELLEEFAKTGREEQTTAALFDYYSE